MLKSPRSDKRSRRRLRWLRRRLAQGRADEGGAVLILCLAALLILLLISWAVLDGIFVIQDKAEVQASADVGAYSQASINARTMNMLAFTNVAKRSLVGVYGTYEGMYGAFEEWVIDEFWPQVISEGRCDWPDDTVWDCDDVEWRNNFDLLMTEMDTDYQNFQFNQDFYLADLRALHNYQLYALAMTPWWGWSEAVLRAQRNGATLATSFPPPHIGSAFPFPDITDDLANQAGANVGFVRRSSKIAELPVELPTTTEGGDFRIDFYGAMYEDGMEDRQDWLWEHQMNVEHHRSRSQYGAADNTDVIERGEREFFRLAMRALENHEEFRDLGTPWRISYHSASSEGQWLFATSNLVITYRHHPEYFRGMSEAYEGIGENVEVDGDDRTQQTYRPSGYWGMARAEISYQEEGEPTMWRPVWTARMRPVALPNEFRQANEEFVMMHRTAANHLLLSAHMHQDLQNNTAVFFDDMVYFERVARGMDQSTIDGVAR